jgi:hypothetical protein
VIAVIARDRRHRLTQDGIQPDSLNGFFQNVLVLLRITPSMSRLAWVLRVAILLLTMNVLSAALYATDGTFQGTVVDPPASEQARPGWIFIQGPNRSLRRVEVSHAVVTLGPQVARHQKGKCGWECLAVGQEIKVTADQDAAGEWRAKRVEILRLAPSAVHYS